MCLKLHFSFCTMRKKQFINIFIFNADFFLCLIEPLLCDYIRSISMLIPFLLHILFSHLELPQPRLSQFHPG